MCRLYLCIVIYVFMYCNLCKCQITGIQCSDPEIPRKLVSGFLSSGPRDLRARRRRWWQRGPVITFQN